MRLPERLTRFAFFTGKGGVGKTSLACASAVALAESGRRVLLVSTDPASNLGDVLGVRATGRPEPVPDVPGLHVVDVDPIAAAAAYRARVVAPYRGVLPESALGRLEEELSGACTVEIAAFDEFTALLTDADLGAAYDRIIFDTAPTGHTLRLLRLPGAWTGFIATNTTGVSCLGPLAGLQSQQARYAEAVAVLADATRTTVVLVARPEASALDEIERTRHELAGLGVRNQVLVVNGVFRAADPEDAYAAALEQRGRDTLAALPAGLAGLERLDVPLLPIDTVGLGAVRALLADGPEAVRDAAPAKSGAGPAIDLPPLAALVDKIEGDGGGLVMVMGKGGVGKTTIAAALAVALADRGHAVHLTTTDPAAHLVDTLAGAVPNLTVDRIDPAAETEAYRVHVRAEAGGGLDERAAAILEEDLRSPCTEEVAVFQAFSRVVAEAEQSFVILDTAPTGHSLLLMDATGSYHREMTRQSRGTTGGDARTTLDRLRDPAGTKVLLVTLPEPTPVLEAARLRDDLRRARIEPYGWVVNQVLDAGRTRDVRLRTRAAHQLDTIGALTADERRVWRVPALAAEPRGRTALLELGRTRVMSGLVKAVKPSLCALTGGPGHPRR